MRYRACITVLILALSCAIARGQEIGFFPDGFASDFAGVLTAETKTTLEKRLDDVERLQGHTIQFVSLVAHSSCDTHSYAVHMFEEWGMQEGDVLILFFTQPPRLIIVPGNGVEESLSPEVLDRITKWCSVYLASGNTSEAMRTCIEAIIKRLERVKRPPKPFKPDEECRLIPA